MRIDELKLWLIEKISKTNDLNTLNETIKILSRSHLPARYPSALGDDFPLLYDHGINETEKQLSGDELKLTDDEKSVFLEELETAKEEIRIGNVISDAEMMAYVDSLFKEEFR